MPVKRPLLSEDTIIIYVPWPKASTEYLCERVQAALFEFTFSVVAQLNKTLYKTNSYHKSWRIYFSMEFRSKTKIKRNAELLL